LRLRDAGCGQIHHLPGIVVAQTEVIVIRAPVAHAVNIHISNFWKNFTGDST